MTPGWRVVCAVAVVCALLGGIAWFQVGRGESELPDDVRSVLANEAAGSSRVAPSVPAEVSAAGVVLPRGAREVSRNPTGFPYSDLGAAAVPVAIARAQVGFDVAQAEAVATTYAVPGQQRIFVQRARAAVAGRRQQAEVPPRGAVPAPATYAATPIAFTVAELEPDYYAVNVLSYLTVTSTRGESRDGYYAGAQLVRWVPDEALPAGGDWKVDAGTPDDQQQLVDHHVRAAVAPGTADFADEGWLLLAPLGSS